MRSPSTAAVHEASVFLRCFLLVAPGADFVQAVLPVARSRQISVRSVPSSLPVCRKIFCFETIGEEFPAPGISTFQRRFCFSPNSIGTPVSAETPVPFGPRKRGQSEAAAVSERSATQATAKSPNPMALIPDINRPRLFFGATVFPDTAGRGRINIRLYGGKAPKESDASVKLTATDHDRFRALRRSQGRARMTEEITTN